MRLTFFGAAGRVTGSCHILEVGGRTLLLDCGLLQGGRKEEALNREPFPFDVLRLDAVVLSHAHIDHSGRLPLLVKAGYRGPVWTHAATTDLCRVMLKDSAYLQEKEAEIQTRKRQRRGEPPVEPLYTLADAGAAMRRFRSLDYGERTTILPGVDVRLLDAGHILGSAIVELWLTEGGQARKLVFSGDLGQKGTPILEDPTPVADADAVLMESTYGDRLHRSRSETVAELKGVLAEALRARGNVLIPAFAVGRSQEMLYLFSREYEDWGLDRWRICLDSPMAIADTVVYAEHEALHDAEARRHWAERGKRLLPNLQIVRTAAQSRALNDIRSGLIVIAASGMCEGGRILHHLKNNLWRKECHVVIVGYQAAGTIGRQLVDGQAYVRLWGEPVRVAATVHTVGGLSAHADRQGLLDWYGAFRSGPPVWLVHGEARARSALADELRRKYPGAVATPSPGESIDLLRLPGRAAAA